MRFEGGGMGDRSYDQSHWALGREAHALLAANSRGPEAAAPVPKDKKAILLPRQVVELGSKEGTSREVRKARYLTLPTLP